MSSRKSIKKQTAQNVTCVEEQLKYHKSLSVFLDILHC